MLEGARVLARQAVAQALLKARRTCVPVSAASFVEALADDEDAYAVQRLVMRELGGLSQSPVQFWKSGGPSRDGHRTHAALPGSGVWTSPAHPHDWPFNFRLIEVEIALRLKDAVSAAQARQLSHDKVHEVVDAICVSLEIVDSRWAEGVTAPALLKLADFQSHGALVLGEWVPYAPRDWMRQSCTVQIGRMLSTNWCGTHSMGDPAWVVPQWLRHATREGGSLPGGTVVTTGTWCGMLRAEQGDVVHAQFAGIGEVRCQL